MQEIKIGPTTFQIHHEELEGMLGEFQEEAGVIRVRLGLPQETLNSTLLHEALHAISAQYGLSLSEAKVRTLETALMMLFKDNPGFLLGFTQAPEAKPEQAKVTQGLPKPTPVPHWPL